MAAVFRWLALTTLSSHFVRASSTVGCSSPNCLTPVRASLECIAALDGFARACRVGDDGGDACGQTCCEAAGDALARCALDEPSVDAMLALKMDVGLAQMRVGGCRSRCAAFREFHAAAAALASATAGDGPAPTDLSEFCLAVPVGSKWLLGACVFTLLVICHLLRTSRPGSRAADLEASRKFPSDDHCRAVGNRPLTVTVAGESVPR